MCFELEPQALLHREKIWIVLVCLWVERLHEKVLFEVVLKFVSVGLGPIGLIGPLRKQNQISDPLAKAVKLVALIEFVPVLSELVRPNVFNLKRLLAKI